MDARVPDLPAETLQNGANNAARHQSGWRGERGEPSLVGMFATVRTAKQGSFWRKLLASLGPGYLVCRLLLEKKKTPNDLPQRSPPPSPRPQPAPTRSHTPSLT